MSVENHDPVPLLIVVDTETTGLPRNPQARPIQVGAVALSARTGEEISSFRILLRPDVWAQGYEVAEEIHKIPRSLCEQKGLGMRAGYDRFTDWLRSVVMRTPWHGASHAIGAWNSAFDREMMERWRRCSFGNSSQSIQWPDITLTGGHRGPQGCLQAAYRAWTETEPDIDTPRYGSLSGALRVLGLPAQPEPHDALTDARLAGLVWWEIERRERKKRQS